MLRRLAPPLVQGWSQFSHSISKRFLRSPDANGWKKSVITTFDASSKPSTEGLSHALRSYKGPVKRSFACSILALDRSSEMIKKCEKLMELDHPYLTRLDQIIDDGAMFAVNERQHRTLLDYFVDHDEDFFISFNQKVFYVTSLFQRLLRELIGASKELHDNGAMFLPTLSSVYICRGKGGLVSVKLSPLQCSSYQYAPLHTIIAHCGIIMESLFTANSMTVIPELDDFIKRAKSGMWWSDIEELFTHPVFWDSAMHREFLNNMDMHMFPTPRPIVNPFYDPIDPKSGTRDGLDHLALVLRREWTRQSRVLDPIVKSPDFPTRHPWFTYKHLSLSSPHQPPLPSPHQPPLYRQARNVLSHHNESHYYQLSRPWACRVDFFLHELNYGCPLTLVLFNTFKQVEKDFEIGNFLGINTVNWDLALASILPK